MHQKQQVLLLRTTALQQLHALLILIQHVEEHLAVNYHPQLQETKFQQYDPNLKKSTHTQCGISFHWHQENCFVLCPDCYYAQNSDIQARYIRKVGWEATLSIHEMAAMGVKWKRMKPFRISWMLFKFQSPYTRMLATQGKICPTPKARQSSSNQNTWLRTRVEVRRNNTTWGCRHQKTSS